MRRIISVAGAVVLLAGGLVGAAGNAYADDTATLEMPDLTDMRLDQAVEAVAEVDPSLQLRSRNINGTQDPLVLKNWKVCWQAPQPGEAVDPKSTWTGVGVTRLSTDCY